MLGVTVLDQPAQGRHAVFQPRRVFVLGRQAVVDGHHGRAALVGHLAAHRLTGVDAAHHKAAAMQVQEHRQVLVVGAGPQACRDVTGRAGNGEVLDTGQGHRWVSHRTHPRGIGLAGHLHRLLAQRRKTRATDAVHQGLGVGGKGQGLVVSHVEGLLPMGSARVGQERGPCGHRAPQGAVMRISSCSDCVSSMASVDSVPLRACWARRPLRATTAHSPRGTATVLTTSLYRTWPSGS